jgi:hypothetical protein
MTTVPDDVVDQVQQLKDQQALITQALTAMVNGTFTGAPPSVEAFLVALDPTLADVLVARTPAFGEAEPWWNPTTRPVRQNKSWNCSCASTAWVLQSMGIEVSQEDVVQRLGPARVNPTWGLMDGSGAALAELIEQETGWPCGRRYVSYDDVFSLADVYPLALGLHGMYHWVACVGTDEAGHLKLANPAPGYQGVGDIIDRDSFNRFGPVSAVWCKGPNG